MSKRLIVQRLRDGAFVVAAFAMVLYVTVADHRHSGPNGQLEAHAGGFVARGPSIQSGSDDQVASIRSDALLP